jgi:polar amino acid transport system permease protein
MNLQDIFLGDQRYLYLWHGLEVTLLLTIFAAAIGLILGLIIALFRESSWQPFSWLKSGRLKRWKPLSSFARIYVTVIRGTPALVQLLIMYYVVFGTYRDVPKLWVASIAFGINSAAYVAEIFRGGIGSIDRGQSEAARSLGLSKWQTMRYVVLPQALRNSLPALINEFISLLKETAIVGWIGMNDLMRGADNIRFQTATAFESLFVVALIYLALTTIFTSIMNRVERNLRASDKD